MHCLCEPLESRTFLTGVTLITHGYEPAADLGGDVSRPSWLDAMKDAIVARAGPDTSVFALRINHTGTTAFVQSFTQMAGPTGGPTAGGANADTVIMLDWASASGVISSFISTAQIANLVVPYLESAKVAGVGRPLAELPVHLIGHSRGGSLVTALASDLGAAGIWVDQVTTLDPRPVNSDPAAQLPSNVIFADNYYQTADVITGLPVDGAHNVNLTQFYNIADTLTYHDDMHTYYQGTIDTSTSGSGAAGLVQNVWYSTPATGPRAQIGFYYSELAGGTRPADGVGLPFGGAGDRIGTNPSGSLWPNIAAIQIKGGSADVVAGQPITGTFDAQDLGGTATVTWMLDPDMNPYNGNEITLYGSQIVPASSTVHLGGSFTISTAAVRSGIYHLVGKISDAGHTRYDEAAGTVTVSEDPRIPLFVEHVYEDVLGRTADQSGLATWTTLLQVGAVTQQQTAQAFLTSTEYRTRLIQGIYSSALGRTADGTGLASWLSFMAAGGTYELVKSEIYSSDEYFNIHDGTADGLVDSYYVAFLGRHAEPDGLTFWTGALNAGATRFEVATAIEVVSPEGAADVVTGAYQMYLHRNTDTDGFNYWVVQVQQGKSQVDMALSFLSSPEYFART